MAKKLAIACMLVAAVVSSLAFKIDYRTITNTPVHETITKRALDDVVVYFPSGKVGRIKPYFAAYLAEENTENDENGINEGILHFDDSQLVDSARHAYFAVQNAISAFRSGDYVTSDTSEETNGISTSYESKVQANLGSAMHTVQDFFAHSTWVETNKFFGAFNTSEQLGDWALRKLPLPKIGILEYPFNEAGFLAQDGIALLDDKKNVLTGDNIDGACYHGGYDASALQITSAYYDFKMSALGPYAELNLGFSTSAWNGQCVATGATEFDGRNSCSSKISWPRDRCVHGDHLAGINKDDESRPLHAPAFNSALQATREMMLYFLKASEAVTNSNESAACKLIFTCATGETPLKIEAPVLIQNPYNRPSWDSRSVYAFKLNQTMNYLLEVSFNGRACQLLDEALTVTSAPEKFFACDARYSETGPLKIYQKANPTYFLYQAENFVANPPAPSVSFTAAPANITQGASATLQWTSANAIGCAATGAWSGDRATSGALSVTPSAAGSFAYTLTCSGAGGTVAATANLSVTAAPPTPTVSLTSSSSSITAGTSATLQWTSTNATSCTSTGAWSGSRATGGALSVTPSTAGNYAYTLTCTGAGGTSTATANLAVTAPTPTPTVSLTSSPSNITAGASATLQWTTNNATSCTASGAWSGSRATSGSLSVTQSTVGSYAYALTCTGTGGTSSATANLSVTAATPAPTVSLMISPGSISLGANSTLQWSSTNASSCTASGAWSGAKASSGTQVLSPAAGGYTYTLTCTGSGGTANASASLTVSAETSTCNLDAIATCGSSTPVNFLALRVPSEADNFTFRMRARNPLGAYLHFSVTGQFGVPTIQVAIDGLNAFSTVRNGGLSLGGAQGVRPDFNSDTYHDYVIESKGGVMKIYVDGVVVRTSATTFGTYTLIAVYSRVGGNIEWADILPGTVSLQ